MAERNVTRALTHSLVLFALNSIAGILPLVFSMLAYHWSLSAREEDRLRSDKWMPYVRWTVIFGDILLVAIVLLVVAARAGWLHLLLLK